MSTVALLEPLPLGRVTPATLKRMVQIVRRYKSDLTTITAARRITSDVPERATRSIVEKLQGWVRDHIRYVNDPRGLEMVQTPPRTLPPALSSEGIGTGDCDDKAVLLATLLETMGASTGFCAMGFRGEPFSHVLALVRLGQRWCPLETIVPGVGPGWSPPDATSHLSVYV